MKINILPGCILAASMVLTTSCSDFLTEDPKGQMTPENVFKTTEDLDLSLTSLYGSLLGLQCNSNTTIVQVMGDDVTSTTGSNKAAYLASDAFEVPSDVKGSEDLWRNLYAIIKNCNYTIDCAKHIGVAETEVSETLGQAYFWRAYAYLMLVRTFGPVPVSPENVLSLSLEETSDATPLTSVEDIYKNIIISDLIKADGFNLPAQYEGDRKSVNGSNIYVSRQAVKSVLVAAYMSMAGYPLHKNEFYARAADKAKEAIDIMNQTGANSLLDDWKDVYSYGNNYSKECILGLYYNPNTGSWGSDDSQFTSCHVLQYYKDWQGWGDFLAERKFWKDYPEGPRKNAVFAESLLTLEGNSVDWWATKKGEPYTTWEEDGKKKSNAIISDFRPMYTGFAVNQDNGAPVAAPFDCTKPIYAGMTLAKTHQLVRVSEVLCWFAEASARSHKYTTEARAALKKVRARAWADAAKVAAVDNMTDDQLAQAAYEEHRYEVAGNVMALVTCREDMFRMMKDANNGPLKDHFDYRCGAQDFVLVPAGTLTRSQEYDEATETYRPVTYTLAADIKLPEEYAIENEWRQWRGESSIYTIYPPSEVLKNPYLVRK